MNLGHPRIWIMKCPCSFHFAPHWWPGVFYWKKKPQSNLTITSCKCGNVKTATAASLKGGDLCSTEGSNPTYASTFKGPDPHGLGLQGQVWNRDKDLVVATAAKPTLFLDPIRTFYWVLHPIGLGWKYTSVLPPVWGPSVAALQCISAWDFATEECLLNLDPFSCRTFRHCCLFHSAIIPGFVIAEFSYHASRKVFWSPPCNLHFITFMVKHIPEKLKCNSTRAESLRSSVWIFKCFAAYPVPPPFVQEAAFSLATCSTASTNPESVTAAWKTKQNKTKHSAIPFTLLQDLPFVGRSFAGCCSSWTK